MEFERLDVGRRVLFLTDEQRVALANVSVPLRWVGGYERVLICCVGTGSGRLDFGPVPGIAR
jgi:hypothetical protein